MPGKQSSPAFCCRCYFFLIVSTIAVFGCFWASLTGINFPLPASRPIFMVLPAIELISFRRERYPDLPKRFTSVISYPESAAAFQQVVRPPAGHADSHRYPHILWLLLYALTISMI